MIVVKIKGGLGNQLFQYAAALQLNKLYGNPIVLDLSFFEEEKFKGIFRLDKFPISYSVSNHVFRNKRKNLIRSIRNKLFYYSKLIMGRPYGNVISGDDLGSNYYFKLKECAISSDVYLLDGWLQSFFYFSHVRNLLSEYLMPSEIDNTLVDLEHQIQTASSVSVHIRRGDMESNSFFKVLGEDYYKEAVAYILSKVENPTFFVFSDEPEKAEYLLSFIKCAAIFIQENSQRLGYYSTMNDFIDFNLMRLCKHHIIANSTFSWWPAYLNNSANHIVVAPIVWNQLGGPSSLLYQDWHLIHNK
ncbi:MAG: alpha-1,2-fucosyltransferase [Eubacteriales bacterium]|nr:alpha-1,2-fucosyltransferase [Eubacteriales bacterium]MDD4475997.1 alpha-1,2-fucosyltransferase [Eubacteriales bacterium]